MTYNVIFVPVPHGKFYPIKVGTTYICQDFDTWKTRKQVRDMLAINFNIAYISKSHTPNR